MIEHWSTGHITPFWGKDEFKKFDYFRLAAPKEDVERWQEEGYGDVKHFTGKTYDNSNPMPEWISKFESIFSLTNMTFTFYKMETMNVMPLHLDRFNRYIQLYQCDPNNIRRVIIMLEDWKSGHYLEINGVGIVNWKAGDWYMWKGDVPHAASNIGLEDRYTLQITGEEVVR